MKSKRNEERREDRSNRFVCRPRSDTARHVRATRASIEVFPLRLKYCEVRQLTASAMSHFLYKLIGPRPTFPRDMTESERVLMSHHSAYWREFFNDDVLLVLGPVLDPNGAYGIAIIHVNDDATAKQLAEADPAIKAALGFRYELHPMLAVTKETAA